MAVIGEFNMLGRVAVVTGGNSGLGFETAQKLAAGGADVVLACRDYRAAVAAKKNIQEKSKVSEDKIHPMFVDLSNLTSVKTFSVKLKEKFKEIHVLVCNAGIMISSHQHSENALTLQGHSDSILNLYSSENETSRHDDSEKVTSRHDDSEKVTNVKQISEIHFLVNHLGHFCLVHHLVPVLLQSPYPRLVVVSSMLLKEGRLDLDNLDRPRSQIGRTPPAYADSKLMNSLFAREAQRRWPGLSVYCVSPGWCRTSLHRNTSFSWWQYPLMILPLALFSRSASSGSDTIVYCAAGRGEYLVNNRGKFFRDRKVEDSIEALLDSHEDKIKPLWNLSEKLILLDLSR